MEVEPPNENFLGLRNIYPVVASGSDVDIRTQADLLRQDELLEEVARRLRLEQRPEYQPAAEASAKLKDNVAVAPVKGTRLLQIVCHAGDPRLAAGVANTIAAVFVERSADSERRYAGQTLQALQPRIAALCPDRRTNEKLCRSLLEQANIASLASRVYPSRIRVVTAAQPPFRPVKPNVPVNLALGLVGGTAVAIGLVLLRERESGPLRAQAGKIPRPAILSFAVAGYVLLLPYQFQAADGINFAPADCLMLLALLAPGELKFRKAAWSGWHFAIAGLFVLGSIVAVLRVGELNRYELLNKDLGLLLPFLSYVAITSAVDEWRDLRRILRVFVGTVVLQNIVSVGGFLLAYFFGWDNPFARYGGLRLSGMLLDPNAYGGLLVAAFAANEGASLGTEPLFRRPILWISRLSLAMGLLFTFSRSAWIALGISLLLLSVIRLRATLRIVVGAAIAAPCIFFLMGDRFVPIFEVMASRPKQVQGRFDLIHDAFDAFTRHPFFGGGLGSFRLSEGEIAHNTTMWFLADFGVVGLVVLVGFLGWFLVKGWAAWRMAPTREKPLAAAALLGHAGMIALAMGIEAFYQRHWWLMVALIASSYCICRGPETDPMTSQAIAGRHRGVQGQLPVERLESPPLPPP